MLPRVAPRLFRPLATSNAISSSWPSAVEGSMPTLQDFRPRCIWSLSSRIFPLISWHGVVVSLAPPPASESRCSQGFNARQLLTTSSQGAGCSAMEAFGFQISRRCRRSLAQNLLLPGLGVGRPAALALELSHRCSSTAAMELRRQAVAEQPEVASFFSRTNAHLLNGFMGTAAAATQQQLSQQAHPGESSSGCLQAAYVDAITNMSRNRGAPYFHSETEGLSLSPLSAMEEVEQSLQETKVSQVRAAPLSVLPAMLCPD